MIRNKKVQYQSLLYFECVSFLNNWIKEEKQNKNLIWESLFQQ